MRTLVLAVLAVTMLAVLLPLPSTSAVDAYDRAAAVARTATMYACTVTVYEDGSWEHKDPEDMTPSCQHFVGYYVGGPLARRDRAMLSQHVAPR